MTDSADERELCGGECADGTPCQNYAEGCPWDHGGENDTGRKQYDPAAFIDDFEEELKSGTVPRVACAKIGVSYSWYKDARARGRQDDADAAFADFLTRTTRARRIGAQSDLDALERMVLEERDTRTAHKIVLKKHGNTLFGAEGDRDPEAPQTTVEVENTVPDDVVAAVADASRERLDSNADDAHQDTADE
jgi:hypothetical protein